ncbi:hypothetical protein [Anaerovorax odorimutans]|uniref:hypothetical protein n=1 Tax=Anaerovorax odorimutans TaxID=109327 RepID=UPI0003FD8100|nr:hypothetical protein [Anaerovorax odorimutans]
MVSWSNTVELVNESKRSGNLGVYSAKESPASYDIIIASSRHTECVCLLEKK